MFLNLQCTMEQNKRAAGGEGVTDMSYRHMEPVLTQTPCCAFVACSKFKCQLPVCFTIWPMSFLLIFKKVFQKTLKPSQIIMGR